MALELPHFPDPDDRPAPRRAGPEANRPRTGRTARRGPR